MPLELIVLNSPTMDGWKCEIKDDGWWLIKIKITLQSQNLRYQQRHLAKIMTGTEQQPNKQTSILRHTKTGKNLVRQKNKKLYLQIDAQEDLQVNTYTERNRQTNNEVSKQEK